MTRETAKKLTRLLMEASDRLEDAVNITWKEASDEEAKVVTLQIRTVMASLLLDVLAPHVWSQHPEFDVTRNEPT
jgi:hypothetical protein